MTGKNILLTGGTGFIGSSLVPKLVKQGYNLALVVRNKEKAQHQFGNLVEYIEFNISTLKVDVENFLPSSVIHLASYSSSHDDKETMLKLIESNIVFISLLLNALSEVKIKFFFNAGSFSEYHIDNSQLNPTYFYSATKISAKFIVDYFSQLNDFIHVNTIIYSVYGKQSVTKKIIDYSFDALGSSTSIKMSHGKQVLDFIHIDDITGFYIAALEQKEKLISTDYFLGTGKGTSIRNMVIKLEKLTAKKANIDWGSRKSRKRDTVYAVSKPIRHKAIIDWKAEITLDDGLIKYLNIVEKDSGQG